MTIKEMFDMTGKVAVVTGGTGIVGKHIAEGMAEAGATTVIASRNQDRCEEYANELRGRGLDAVGERIDLSDEGSILDLVKTVNQRCGKIDALINNSVLRCMSDAYDPVEKWEESMRVNLTGVYLLSRAVLKDMIERKSGSIVNIGSIQGMIGPDLSLYVGTDLKAIPDYFVHKHGMVGMTKFLAALGGPHGVRVNCVSPGGFDSGQTSVFTERYDARTYLKRMANGEDIKGAVVYLASDASIYVTGANLPVDGGYTAN